MTRCFIAIDFPEEIKEFLLEIISKIKKANPSENLNYTKKENLHLTLAFLGEIDETKIEDLKKAISKIKFYKFKAKFSKLGVFPSEKFIRVLWTGLDSEKDEIFELRKDIEKVLEDLNISFDEKFKSHITLARIKFLHNMEKFVENIKKVNFAEKNIEIDRIKIKKSELGENGSVYSDLINIPAL